MKIYDLSWPITTTHPHWQVNIQKAMGHERGDPFQVLAIQMNLHAFTHIDGPRHRVPDGPTLDAIPLSYLVREAAIVDLSDKGANDPITAADLEQRGRHVRPGDIAVLKTLWPTKCPFESEEFWQRAPYLAPDAAQWLVQRGVVAVGYDFPQEYVIREQPRRPVAADEWVIHETILRNGILNIEYLAHLEQITRDRILLVALPLKVEGADGALARVIALED